jgi:hypothetical protein
LPPSLFFDGLRCNAPNKGTNDSECKPDGSRPAHGVGERRRHELMAPLLYPWRESEGKADESRVAAAWVGCCVVVFLCCVLCCVSYVLFTHFVTTPGDISPPFLSMIPCSNAPPKPGWQTAMHSGCVSGSKKGGVQLGLAVVLRGENMHFLRFSVRLLW